MWFRSLGAVALVVAGAACAEVSDDWWAGAIEERDGVTWVLNPAADPGGEDAPPPFALHLEQTFGADEAPAEALLGFVTGLTVDGDGNRLRYELREYGLDGTLRRVIAREHPELIPSFVYRGTGFGLGSFEPPMWLSDEFGLVPRRWLVGVQDVEEIKRRWDQYLASRDPEDEPRSFESAIDLIDGEGRVLGSLPISGAFRESPMGRPELVGPDGRLYTIVSEPYPHVRRYRVEIVR